MAITGAHPPQRACPPACFMDIASFHGRRPSAEHQMDGSGDCWRTSCFTTLNRLAASPAPSAAETASFGAGPTQPNYCARHSPTCLSRSSQACVQHISGERGVLEHLQSPVASAIRGGQRPLCKPNVAARTLHSIGAICRVLGCAMEVESWYGCGQQRSEPLAA